MKLDEKLKEIKERCEAATEGPWNPIDEQRDTEVFHHVVKQFEGGRTYIAGETGIYDGPFIAHARTDLPMLLEMVEETIKSIGHHGCFCAGDNDGTGASYFCLGHELQRDFEKIAEKYK